LGDVEGNEREKEIKKDKFTERRIWDEVGVSKKKEKSGKRTRGEFVLRHLLAVGAVQWPEYLMN
jgi:hypothetical protein